ncbi:hypothetical protein SAMN04487785_115109 [Dyella jiangningensis]|uniref:hypothetical protein n=1 Tax=Dyella sp. AtDHG13 TaxID=1938897 RepID=UPI00087EEFB1|nr:hypothetical protein [Dyella sp. AtDHG13]PXV58532.1 hypothetical protein BDW41_10539 [Dyella sp. AtDHG13]SDL16572.1 hypothetical protein SAMN04487785_115109 [Dyella jiangningensis]
MKKSPLVVALPVLALSALLLSGCGMFRSQKAWETAKQETPLEIPPGLDTPSTSAALVIPETGANNPTANGARARVGQAGGQIADGFVLNDTVDNTYHRVSRALENGDIGQIVGHDDDAHTLQLSVVATDQPAGKKGFFSSMFNGKSRQTADAPGATPHQVQLTVNTSGQAASEVRAQGDAAAVAKVIDTLKGRLGGG